MRKALVFIASGFAAAMPLMAVEAQQAEPAAQAGPLNPRAVVAEVRRSISELYVLPDRRPAIDAMLAEGLASGRYDVTDARALAERIDADLKTVGHDKHLTIWFDPRQAETLAAKGKAAAPGGSGFERQVRAANHGVAELRLLPGNIRYMAYNSSMWIGPESAAVLEAAMRFLGGGEAVIIDIRRNGGGRPEPSQFMLSHFMPPDQPLYTFYKGGSADRVFTLPKVAAGRMVGKPLYVLTSPATASAAEEFAGNVAGYRLGEVVGETTAGAGFMNTLVPIGGGFVLSVSTARVVLASTGRDWEATGISPTIRTPTLDALDAAQAHALRRLLADAPAEERPRLEALADRLAARLKPRTPELPFAAYAGQFGRRTVIAEAGKLYYQRPDRSRALLIPLGGNRFAFDDDPELLLEFAATAGAVKAFTIMTAGGRALGTYERTD
jgi:hypothetical protein